MTSSAVLAARPSHAIARPARRALARFLGSEATWSGPILRLTLALVMFPHGAQKVLGWFGGYGLSASLDAFTTHMGIPAPIALLVFAGELLGPLLLVAGLGTRFAAGSLALIMTGALAVHWQHGFFMNWSGQQGGEGFEFHLLAIGLALALAVSGAGRASLDRVLARRLG